MRIRSKRFDQLYRSRDVTGLQAAMQDAPRRRRVAVVAALREAGTPDAEAALIEALSDPSPFVRRVAVEALAEINPDRDPAPIIGALRANGSTVSRRPTKSSMPACIDCERSTRFPSLNVGCAPTTAPRE